MQRLLALLVLLASTACLAAVHGPRYLLTNDDVVYGRNSVTFYQIGGMDASPTLTRVAVVETGGMGLGGGPPTASAIVVDGAGACAYAADSGSSDVAAIDIATKTVVGKFRGSWQDSGGFKGVGLAMNEKYLYASYTGNYSLATYEIGPGCQLTWIKSQPIIGQNLGMVSGLAANDKMLVVTYGDGSIESYDVSDGVPKSNGDRQLSTGTQTLLTYPFGIILTRDGHYAIFGDSSSHGVIEVADISGGSLAPATVYKFWRGMNSVNIHLSPDEKMLYVSNNGTGTVSALYFDNRTGKVFPGCISNSLQGWNDRWFYDIDVVPNRAFDSGGSLFVAEYGWNGSIAMVNVAISGHNCSLTEVTGSPVKDPESQSLRSLAVAGQ